MNWFKFYGTEYLADQKIAELSATERSCWLTLLCYASESNGIVKHVNETKLMQQAGVNFQEDEWEQTEGVLKHFEDLEMIVTDSNGIITVLNWKKRQESSLTNAERQARFRERNKSVTDSNVTVTLDKKRVDKIREEENTDTRSQAPFAWNKSLFDGFKDFGVLIADSEDERARYPRNMRRKNPDVGYWLAVGKFSQTFSFKGKDGKYVSPWAGPVKLSKLYYEVREKYDEQVAGETGREKIADMKKGFAAKTMQS